MSCRRQHRDRSGPSRDSDHEGKTRNRDGDGRSRRPATGHLRLERSLLIPFDCVLEPNSARARLVLLLMLCLFLWSPSPFADISRLLILMRIKAHKGYLSKLRIRGGGVGINFECPVPPRPSLHISHAAPLIFGPDPPLRQCSRAPPYNQTRKNEFGVNSIPVFDAMSPQPLFDSGVPNLAIDPEDSARQGLSRSSTSATEETQEVENRDVLPKTACSIKASHRWMQFEDARDLVRKHRFLLRSHFWAWKERPKDIPYNPDKIYKFVGWAGMDYM